MRPVCYCQYGSQQEKSELAKPTTEVVRDATRGNHIPSTSVSSLMIRGHTIHRDDSIASSLGTREASGTEGQRPPMHCR